MSQANPSAITKAAPARSRRRLVALLLLGWTVVAGLAVWYLMSQAASSGNSVFRVGPGETKSWTVSLHENIALARLNFPWALAWVVLTPYVLWIGVRFSFEGRRWQNRLFVLLATGIAFVWASQWLSKRIGAGEATIIMVKYTTDTSIESQHAPGVKLDESGTAGVTTNHLVTNRFTKIVLSGESLRATNHASWEMATSEILSGIPTNLPQLLAGGGGGFLPPAGSIGARRWSAALDWLAYVALIGLAHTGVFYRRYREREQQAVRLESKLNEARLRALKAQLQPHFLFNTLNGIATLLRRDPATAEEMLLSLSELLRISLSTSHRQEIPLREEMNFLGRYLAIQQMRFGDRLHVREEIDPAAMDCLVPALLLQPLVENAIRHGLEPSGQSGELLLTGSREGEWLELAVEDNGVGLRADNSGRAGVGLANVRERLAALHGEQHEFSISERPTGGVSVNIRLPAKTEVGVLLLPEEVTA